MLIDDVMQKEQKEWVIVTRDSPVCPYCLQAKAVLDGKNLEFVEIDLESAGVMEMFRERGFRTVPQVFHQGKHIGGYEALKSYLGESTIGQRTIRGDANLV